MFSPGDVVVIPYPFTNQTRTKLRPVLVITAPDGQGDFIGLAITSKGYHANAIALTQPDMQTGKLPRPSWVRTDKVFTLNDSLMVNQDSGAGYGRAPARSPLRAMRQDRLPVAIVNYNKEARILRIWDGNSQRVACGEERTASIETRPDSGNRIGNR
jgi:mRNA interferase MazF